ncbi:MAG: hypothetical protein FWC70_10590 [Defluviitaleaceae bacterium]|nr:hypothetical protein [Defluviitaleaceae bacterium]
MRQLKFRTAFPKVAMPVLAGVAIVAMLLLSGCARFFDVDAMRESAMEWVRVYDVDFSAEFSDTFDAMFDNNWTVISADDRFVVPDEYDGIAPVRDRRPMRFNTFEIGYTDALGNARTITFDSRATIASRTEAHIADYMQRYFQNYFDAYQECGVLSILNVHVFLLNATANATREENREFVYAIAEYRRRMDTPEGAIPLARLTPYNMFEYAPVYLSVSMNISEDFEASLKEVESMFARLNELTNYRLNASVQIIYRPERADYRWYFVRGERRESSSCDFQRHVFEGHRGVFWE